MRKIGILGGTFDPVHIGHLVVADQVLFYEKLDEIWFMPAYKPPHKKMKKITSIEHRVNMINSILPLDSRYRLCTIEMERDVPSYTLDTMKELNKRYPADAFYFIIGGDMIKNLANWYGIDDLMNIVNFIGLERIGYTHEINTDHEKKIYDQVSMVPMPKLEISSSLIRKWIKCNRAIRYVVPEVVDEYIKEHKLYAED